MILPRHLRSLTEWLFVGPMGPCPPENFEQLPQIGVDGGAHFSSQLKVWVGDHECQILLYDSDGKIRYHLLGAGLWKFTHHGLFSLGTLKKTTIKMTGMCQYPIPESNPLIPLSSIGLSNTGHGEIELETEGSVLLYFPEGE